MYDHEGNEVSAQDVLSPEELEEYYKQHPKRRDKIMMVGLWSPINSEES